MELPTSFTDYTCALLGDEDYAKLETVLGQEQPVSIRLNKLKIDSEKAINDQLNRVPWCTSGFYLQGRLTFTFDPMFHAGCD